MPEKTNRRSITPLQPLVLTINLQDDHLKGSLINESGRILVTQKVPVKQTTVRATVAAISQLIIDLATAPDREQCEIKAIGISVPGIIDHRSERVSFTSHDTFNWERVPLRSMIEKTLVNSGIDVRLSSEASPARIAKMTSAHPVMIIRSTRDAQVVAEAWCGVAAGKTNVVLLSLGQEITTSILANGKVLHGAGDLAGATGWLALSENFKAEYAVNGAFSFEASAAALVRKTLEKWSPDSESLLSQLTKSNPAQLDAATIIRAARSGDPLALSVMQETCAWVGRAAANLICLLNPEAIVLSGKFGISLKPFISDIRREAKKWTPSAALKQCQIVSAKPDEQAELLGVAKLAWEQIG